jgi:flavin reductase (DIM6/NTAB) family NADH-FMN oxidoreductase RutF
MKTMLTERESGTAIQVNPIFIGYKPVIFALPDNSNSLIAKEYCLNFISGAEFDTVSKWNGYPTSRNSVARMLVSFPPVKFKTLPGLTLLRGEKGEHLFLKGLHKTMNLFRDKLIKDKPGNVDLPGNLHDMVRIAYSVPRIIGLVSIVEGSLMNLFPTDLHGQLDEKFYISSLRIGGYAQQQVEHGRKIVLCEIESDLFGEAYKLGKNHMKEFSPIRDFNLHASVSEKFGFPLPTGVLRYFELTVLESVDLGIHRIFLYKIENIVNVRSGNTLSHIHQYYAEWRRRNGMKTDLLLR